ncbi:hypothetical protein EYF80_034305 [Liparis tanakae]|uniref:Uncharacterized protein n=1 Tax=Liparis tanakae TaxID=230148 RepID=A0A4Z2GRS5_9TELE|nr:hypothetical protein EYF80_034305 [Liparis tanakae]
MRDRGRLAVLRQRSGGKRGDQLSTLTAGNATAWRYEARGVSTQRSQGEGAGGGGGGAEGERSTALQRGKLHTINCTVSHCRCKRIHETCAQANVGE